MIIKIAKWIIKDLINRGSDEPEVHLYFVVKKPPMANPLYDHTAHSQPVPT